MTMPTVIETTTYQPADRDDFIEPPRKPRPPRPHA